VPITHQSSARYRRRKSQGEHFCTRSRQAQIYYQRLPCLNTILRVNILSTSLSTASQHAKSAGIACIIFTCYEYLAGNYKAADMHLQNGLRILHQHKGQFPSLPNTLSHIVVNTVSFRSTSNDLLLQLCTEHSPGVPTDIKHLQKQ
jgi:hypothetical protein